MAIEYMLVEDALGTQRKIAVDLVNTDEYAEVIKVGYGGDGTLTLAEDAAGLPVRIMAGTNNMGDVDVLTVPAADRTTDSMAVALQTGAIMLGNTALTPKFAFISAPVSATTTLVAAVTGKKIRVHQLIAVAGSTLTQITFNNTGFATAPTFINAANGGEVLPFSPMGWFETNSGSALTVTTGAGSATGILVGYTEV